MSTIQELTVELEEKQDVFRSLQDTAEILSLENHPAKQTVEVRISGENISGVDLDRP